MTSTGTASGPRRKPPQMRRDEIAAAAGRIAIAEGLVQVTAKRVAEAVGVYPGLVNHYFRSADELVAAGFAAAAESRREKQAAHVAGAANSPTAELRMFLNEAIATEHDSVALLWLDAWRESPRRPPLQLEVIRQMEIDLADLTALLSRGVDAGDFSTDDIAASAMRILAMIDGTFGQSAVRTALRGNSTLNYPIVTEMLLRTTERELGLAAGVLG
ncbi:TetR family transcriptional regulator C-terminal domain-containing protein [Mycobacterium sp. 21AC1]|uniref:TetR family transcriptional regulator C-terminal domain-containing protein n=1 Tax=[Mycobacterium] appelbergii TaxID=2939269 RepID=UPI0029391BF3|nr:TetR family transcriptional regulator C-terminal domain-containing protein [Mycobacterium sp. 21AC1]MDV3125968.1 TetR family transcriptional regulator C-terminal domain-containing protein [Mycobacterium sp. 21AC1]